MQSSRVCKATLPVTKPRASIAYFQFPHRKRTLRYEPHRFSKESLDTGKRGRKKNKSTYTGRKSIETKSISLKAEKRPEFRLQYIFELSIYSRFRFSSPENYKRKWDDKRSWKASVPSRLCKLRELPLAIIHNLSKKRASSQSCFPLPAPTLSADR